MELHTETPQPAVPQAPTSVLEKGGLASWLFSRHTWAGLLGVSLLVVLVFGILYAISLSNYLLFHSLAEMASVVIAFSIFVLAWNTRQISGNSYLLLIGIGMLFVGLLDFIHLLAYSGMSVFPGITANTPTQLWIAARYLQAATLVAAPIAVGRKLRPGGLVFLFSLITTAIVASIFVPGMFPDSYIDGRGLTPFKIVSEYVISAMLILAAVLTHRNRQAFEPRLLGFLYGFFGLSILSELAFAAYFGVYDSANMVGHLLKVGAFFLLYWGLVETALVRPYTGLFKGLKSREANLEREHDELEDRFDRIAETAGEGVWFIDDEDRTTFVNQALAEMLGYPPAEILGRRPQDFMDMEFAQSFEERLTRRRRGMKEVYDLKLVRKDGTILWARVSASPLLNDAGEYKGALGMISDVTERNLLLEGLERTNEQLRTLQAIDRAILAAEGPKEIARETVERLLANMACERVSVAVTLRGSPGLHILVEQGSAFADSGSYVEKLDLGLLERSMVNGSPLVYGGLDEDSDTLPIMKEMKDLGATSIALAPLRTEAGMDGVLMALSRRQNAYDRAQVEFLGLVADHLAVALRQAELQEALKAHSTRLETMVAERTAELESANKELEAFTYSVSHDLRAPLRAIDGFSRILAEEKRDALDTEALHYLGLVRKNAQDMGTLIDELLRFSRMSRQAVARELVDLNALVDEVWQGLALDLDGRDVEFVRAELPACSGDRTLLKQVFINLLDNALKFTRPRSPARIEVACEVSNSGENIYRVTDNGVGFDMTYAHKLFGVFQRLHRMEDFEGTGIGLATVQRIIRRHQGRIWAKAELDKGAGFYFTLEASQHGHRAD